MPQGVRGFLCHNVDRPAIDGVLAAFFRPLQALPVQLVSVEVLGNCGKCFRRLPVIRFALRRVHVPVGVVVKPVEPCFLVPLPDVGDIVLQRVAKRLVAEPHHLLVVVGLVKRLLLVRQCLLPADVQFRHQLAQIRLRVFGVEVKHLFAVLVGTAPIAVLQEDEGAFQQGRSVGGSLLYHHGFFGRGLVGFRQLLDAADQILHEAQLRHILRLQMGKLLWQIVGIHIAVGGDQYLFRTAPD